MPQSNAELESAAEAGYVFSGETTIVFNGNTMSVTNGGSTVSKALPSSGVIYVKSTSCSTGYARQQMYAAAAGCGNVRVSGTYSKDITIGADNDIIVTDDFESSNLTAVLGGLIANNFVRVYHPVNNWDGDDCDNNGGPGSIQIDAAILALNHSFIVDNWYCGNDLGHAHRERCDRAEVPWPGRHLLGRVDQQRLREELQLQRDAALPRAAVLREPHRLALEGHPPERAGAGPLNRRSSEATSSGAADVAPCPWPSSVTTSTPGIASA